MGRDEEPSRTTALYVEQVCGIFYTTQGTLLLTLGERRVAGGGREERSG